jgi:hypothetical protein
VHAYPHAAVHLNLYADMRGIGPKAVGILDAALAERGLAFAD